MKSKEAIDPAQVALLGVDGQVGNTNRRDKAGINLRKGIAQEIAWPVGTRIHRLITAGNRWMVVAQWLPAIRPVIPVEFTRPTRFQHVPEQQPQGIHFLPQLPSRELGVWA